MLLLNILVKDQWIRSTRHKESYKTKVFYTIRIYREFSGQRSDQFHYISDSLIATHLKVPFAILPRHFEVCNAPSLNSEN